MAVAEKKPAARKPTKQKKERQPGEPMTKEDLMRAISMGKMSEVEEWFSSGDRDPNDPDTKHGFTLLYHAMKCTWSHHTFGTLGAAARKGGFQIARGLIARGADVNRRMGRYRNTVLHNAAYAGSAESVNFLLDNGAELESAAKHGATPLMRACNGCVDCDCMDTVLALLKRGASLDAVDNEGDGPLDYLRGESFYHMDDDRYGRPHVYEEAKAALAEIKDAGGWKSYAREPRRDLLALRVLCEQGRASPPEAFMPVELLASGVLSAETFDDAKSLARAATCAPLLILKRLFPATPPPPPELAEAQGAKCYRMREGADAGVFSKELFWHILSFWHTFTDDAVVLRDAVRRDHEDYVRRSENGGDY
jgi:hypothetical protein